MSSWYLGYMIDQKGNRPFHRGTCRFIASSKHILDVIYEVVIRKKSVSLFIIITFGFEPYLKETRDKILYRFLWVKMLRWSQTKSAAFLVKMYVYVKRISLPDLKICLFSEVSKICSVVLVIFFKKLSKL